MKLSRDLIQVTDCNKQKRYDKPKETPDIVNNKINRPICVIHTYVLPDVCTRSEDRETEQKEGKPTRLDNSEYPAELHIPSDLARSLDSSRPQNNSSFEYPELTVERTKLVENQEVLEAFHRYIPDIYCGTCSSIAPNAKVDQVRNPFEEIDKMKANGLKNSTAKQIVVEIKSYSDKKREEGIKRCSIEDCPKMQKLASPSLTLPLSEKSISGSSSRKQSCSSNSSYSSVEQLKIDKVIINETRPENLRSSSSSQGSDGVLSSETKTLESKTSQCVGQLNGKYTSTSSRPVSGFFDPAQFNFPVGLDSNLKPSEFLKTVNKKSLSSSLMTKRHSEPSKENPTMINNVKSQTNNQTTISEDFAKNIQIIERIDVPFNKKNDIEVSNPSGNQESKTGEKKKDILQETLSATNKPVFSITKEQLQSVNLKKTGKPSSDDRTVLLKINRSTPVKKNDIIAELKQFPADIDVLRRSNEEGVRLDIEEKRKNTLEIAEDCQREKFAETIPERDSNTVIPPWKQQIIAKRVSEKAHKVSEEEMQKLAEDQKMNAIPEWKRLLMQKSSKSSNATSSRNNKSQHKPLVNVRAAKDSVDYGKQANCVETEGDRAPNRNFDDFKKTNRTGSL
ncbi:uncharacterized protein LOC143230484 [Tachypleus tridentatus]|uniref:uncharacterized protein LOC143230484 n=1 Tax=Tachypleus tridentatus TaxID=6853 RepID=UPI003FD47C64